MKKIILFQLLILFGVFIGSAQVFGEAPGAGTSAESNIYSNFQKKTPMMQELFQKIRNSSSEIKYDLGETIGSPFENKEYKNAKVLYDGEFLGDFYYRFNAYNQEIELKKTDLSEEKIQALIKHPKVTLAANDESYVYRFMQTQNKKTEEGYLKLFYEGDTYKLYERYFVKFKEGKPAENSMVTAISSKFSGYTEYYYGKSDNNIISEIPTKQSKFLKILPKKQTDNIKDYIESNDIDLTNKNDLSVIFNLMEE
ncbi:hypothetical protein [Maribacter sp. IgM3_T14_3]|uniref:hypothetical protein n=1 Tax=Maribacter sp. IgM3_T14_3 TaxID=3415140 RepID=UPI003C6F2699